MRKSVVVSFMVFLAVSGCSRQDQKALAIGGLAGAVAAVVISVEPVSGAVIGATSGLLYEKLR